MLDQRKGTINECETVQNQQKSSLLTKMDPIKHLAEQAFTCNRLNTSSYSVFKSRSIEPAKNYLNRSEFDCGEFSYIVGYSRDEWRAGEVSNLECATIRR